MTELAKLRWDGHVVRMGDDKPKIARQVRSQAKRPKERTRQTWVEGMENILKEKGVECKAKARTRERWKVVCKPATPPDTRGSIE